jgi:hypothetical protein
VPATYLLAVQKRRNRVDKTNGMNGSDNRSVRGSCILYYAAILISGTAQRESMSDIPEEPHSYLAASKITSRKRADSHSPPLTSTRITPNTDTPAYSTTDSMHRQSLDSDQYARRFSSAEEYNSPWRSPMQASQPEIRRLSGNFNAPTCVELERHKDYRRRSKGMDKIKNAVRGWVRA